MNRELALKHYKRAYKYGRFKGFDETKAYDFAGWVLLKKEDVQNINMGFVFVDYLRETIGRPSTKGFEAKRALSFVADTEEMPTIVDQSNPIKLYFDEESSPFHNLPKELRAIAVLRFKWGFTNAEIGYCFAVTESRVSQRLKEIQTRIRQTSKTMPKSKSEGQGELEAVLFEQRQGLEPRSNQGLEKKEPRQMESDYGSFFSEWVA